MYKTLDKVDNAKVLDYLSGVIETELPSPDEKPGNTALLPEFATFKNDLTQEILQKHAPLSANSIEKQRVIFSELSKLISTFALKDQNVTELQDSLGGKGVLSNSHYRITFGNDFDRKTGAFGIRRNHVQAAVQSPDLKHTFLFSDVTNFSLCVKNIEPTWKKPFQLIVILQEEKNSLLVHNAWKMVGEPLPSSALSTLVEFVNKYGLPIQLAGETSLLFLNKNVPIRNLKKPEFQYKVINPEQRHFTTTVTFNIDKPKRVIHVAYVFAVDHQRYLADLGRS